MEPAVDQSKQAELWHCGTEAGVAGGTGTQVCHVSDPASSYLTLILHVPIKKSLLMH